MPSRRAARKHPVASRLPKYFLRLHSAGSVSPGSGRPVRRELGYGPAVRLKPFRPHLTASALSCAIEPKRAQHTPTARTPKAAGAHPGGFPHRRPSPAPIQPHLHPVLDLRSSCARRGITPASGYGPRLGSVRLDFHQLATRPARRALRACPTSRGRSSRNYRLGVPLAARRPLTCHPANHPGRGVITERGRARDLPVLSMRSSHACAGSPTTQGPPTTRDNAANGVAFRAYDRVGTLNIGVFEAR